MRSSEKRGSRLSLAIGRCSKGFSGEEGGSCWDSEVGRGDLGGDWSWVFI